MKPQLARLQGLLLASIMITAASTALPAVPKASLAERLGYKPSDKLLIINGDDAGMCLAANQATIEALENGLMRTCTLMVPCPWFPAMAAYAKANPDKDFGVHLCHTAEWTKYRWAPLTSKSEVPGLFDPDGYMWKGVMDVYTHANAEQALIEGRAQIKRALAAGVDVTHIDSHMGTMQLHPEFVKAYLQLAIEFNLPARMASQETLAQKGFPHLRDEFTARGVLFPDYFVYDELKDENKEGVKNFWLRIVKNLKPGVTELYIHAALPTDELKAITGSWQTRAEEFEVFTRDDDMKRLVKEQNITLIGYRPLRELQHAERRQ